MRRGGDYCSSPLPAEFGLETADDVIALIEYQVQAVLVNPNAGALEKARCVAYLANVSLRAIECGNLAARVEAVETVLKIRKK
jgi:hypothetical protein